MRRGTETRIRSMFSWKARVTLALLGTLILMTACSDQKPLAPNVHPLSWMVESSDNYHGRRVTANGIDFCQECHGQDLRGGTRATSCYRCHGGPADCSGCHGLVMWGFAPPPDLSDNLGTDAIGVGAHLQHVLPSALSEGYECTECHVMPDELASPGHQDDGLPAEVVFGTLAGSGNTYPSWDRSVPACSDVYCHGATLEGGASLSQTWNDFPPEEELCGTCHPVDEISGGGHEIHLDHGFECSDCHNGYSTESVTTVTHVDGTNDVDLSSRAGGSFDGESCSGVRCHGAGHTTPVWGASGNFTCTECHGGGALPPDTLSCSAFVLVAPPTDLSGSSSVSSRGVGVHRSHLVEGELRVNLECTECHVVPATVGEEGHVDTDLVAEVIFGDLASNEDATPEWNPDDAAGPGCTGVYCHGATLEGGSLTDPVWTELIPVEQKCGSCHAIPPHPDYGSCNICHGNVVSADTTITQPGKSLHINGQTDF